MDIIGHKFNIRFCFIFLISTASILTLFLLSELDRNKTKSALKLIKNPKQTKVDYDLVKRLTKCEDKELYFFHEQRGEFFIFYNYVVAKKQFRCYEAVTYTTQGDVTFLDNLIPLVERWNGPISVSIYAPGEDFKLAIESIAYLRNCENSFIKELVTFHLFFEEKFTPKGFEGSLLNNTGIYEDHFNCTQIVPYSTVKRENLFKTRNNLLYHINIARNSARIAAQTYFVLASDIELYPTQNFSSKFIEMVPRNQHLFRDQQKKVFVLPVFEITRNSSIPKNKTVLKEMIIKKQAFIFHKKLCAKCHTFPDYNRWIEAEESCDLNVFTVTKRLKNYSHWEPFFVGTNDDPLFDERLTWEGQKNKMTQNFIQCLLDYDYMVLDNGFLVHRPGMKKLKEQIKKFLELVKKTNYFVRNRVKQELIRLYGNRSGCLLTKR